MKKLVCMLALAFSVASVAVAQEQVCNKGNKTETCTKQNKKDCKKACPEAKDKKSCNKGDKGSCKKGDKKTCPSKAK